MKMLELYNPNRFSIPVTIKNGSTLSQIIVQPKSSFRIKEEQVTDSVTNLTDPSKHLLRSKVID